MPLTIAHPAAVIPIQRVFQRWAVPSALVIGSLIPDLAYVLPIGVSRAESHSVGALFWFCLPVGCTLYVVFHLLLKRPLLSLLPAVLARRLSSVSGEDQRLPARSWFTVSTSLLLGAASHDAWDAFTHEGTWAVRTLEFLQVELFSVGSYRVFVYKALQHVSTVIGILGISCWTFYWLRGAPVGSEPTVSLAPSERVICIVILFGIPAGWGLTSVLSSLSLPVNVFALQIATGRGVLASFSAFGVVLLAFGLWWHLRAIAVRSHKQMQPPPAAQANREREQSEGGPRG